MSKKTIIILIAVVASVGLLILCCGVVAAAGLFLYRSESKISQPPAPVIKEAAAPAVSLTGIWQRSPSMAAGWNDRYHFYPSGTFHFYPSQMACREEKIEKIGTWKVEGLQLTLTTTRQVISRLKIDPGGLCSVVDKVEEKLAQPVIEQLPVVDHGLVEGDIYPSISIDSQQFWKFSDDPSSYGDEKFPEK